MSDTMALRALGALLNYPDNDLRESLPEIRELLLETSWFHRRHHPRLDALLDDLSSGELLDVEARYIDLFERGRKASLYLFEHAYGESRERGQALVALNERYAKANLHLTARELPDFLPVVLEYLSLRSLAEARSLLSEAEPILRRVGDTLQGKHSPYAVIFDALLSFLQVAPLGPPPERAEPELSHEELDAQWQEPPAFDKTNSAVVNFYPNAVGKDSEARS